MAIDRIFIAGLFPIMTEEVKNGVIEWKKLYDCINDGPLNGSVDLVLKREKVIVGA